eukprot:scaffold53277_cov33-Tisochrysis_lutea.AAC.1
MSGAPPTWCSENDQAHKFGTFHELPWFILQADEHAAPPASCFPRQVSIVVDGNAKYYLRPMAPRTQNMIPPNIVLTGN